MNFFLHKETFRHVERMQQKKIKHAHLACSGESSGPNEFLVNISRRLPGVLNKDSLFQLAYIAIYIRMYTVLFTVDHNKKTISILTYI